MLLQKFICIMYYTSMLSLYVFQNWGVVLYFILFYLKEKEKNGGNVVASSAALD